jgi:hypothetical protein
MGDSKSPASRRVGSSPTSGTIIFKAPFLIERGFLMLLIQSLPIFSIVSERQYWRGFESYIRINFLSAISPYITHNPEPF